MEKESLVRLGFVARPHGIRGEAELRLLNPNADECILEEGMRVFLYPSGPGSRLSPKGEEKEIRKLRFGNKVVCLFEGIEDRSALELLLPFEVYLPREEFPELPDGEFYLVDLVGFIVMDPSGKKIGELEGFSDNGAQYLFDVRLEEGGVITLPYVEAFFPEVDVQGKKIVMIMPEYTE